jgi:hypothetical protein
MRKIRRNVFETNSSSSNNLTITTIGKEDPLLFNKSTGTLNIGVFYEKNEKYCEKLDGSSWTAYTRNEKAALLFLYLNQDYDFPFKDHKEYAQKILGYNEILNPNNDSLPVYSGRGGFDIDIETLCSSNSIQLKHIKILDEFIEIINDDNKIITVLNGSE